MFSYKPSFVTVTGWGVDLNYNLYMTTGSETGSYSLFFCFFLSTDLSLGQAAKQNLQNPGAWP